MQRFATQKASGVAICQYTLVLVLYADFLVITRFSRRRKQPTLICRNSLYFCTGRFSYKRYRSLYLHIQFCYLAYWKGPNKVGLISRISRVEVYNISVAKDHLAQWRIQNWKIIRYKEYCSSLQTSFMSLWLLSFMIFRFDMERIKWEQEREELNRKICELESDKAVFLLYLC